MKYFCSFSEAIREGSKLRPQCFGGFFRLGGSCAYGAGAEAVYEATVTSVPDLPMIEDIYPILERACGGCPRCQAVNATAPILCLIYHLNDTHKWTREQIADWLESEEEKLGFVTLTETDQLATTANLLPEESGVLALH